MADPTRPTPDAQGETHPRFCASCGRVHGPYPWDQPPAPPSAPASAPDAERIAEIRQRAQEATPGPWESGAYSTIHSAVCRVTGRVDRTPEGWNNCPLMQDPEKRNEHDADCGPVVAYAETAYGDTPGPQHRKDQEFIAHARADIPWLLEQLDAAQPPPADADALRERVLADWQDCAHCHHWGHQHRGGVCMACDKRDETCGLFAALAAPQPPAGEG